MPPRLRSAQQLLSSHHIYTSQAVSSRQSAVALTSPSRIIPQSRTFSSTPSRQLTRLRRQCVGWLNGRGSKFKYHVPGTTNYLGGNKDPSLESTKSKEKTPKEGEHEEEEADMRVFPLNPTFLSESILSESLRNEIYDQVVNKNNNIRRVSVVYGIDMRRIAAVVRLVELEKRMRSERKQLAIPYARAIHQMVPTTLLAPKGQPQEAHESINDLPLHKLTEPQIFYPVAESRNFTRVDAARVFSAAPELPAVESSVAGNSTGSITRITRAPQEIEMVGKGANEQQVLQPADVRIPHPHLIAYYNDMKENPGDKRFIEQLFRDRLKEEAANDARRKERKKAKEAASTTRVKPDNSRFEFRFREVVVSRETTGLDGRGAKGVGRRYGIPLTDRKRGEVKIPTRVEV